MLTKKTKKKRYNKNSNISTEGHIYNGFMDKTRDAWASAFGGKDPQGIKRIGDIAGSIGAIGQGVTGITDSFMSNAKIADTTEQRNKISDRQTWQSEATDNASLLAEMSSDVVLGNTSWRDIRGVTDGQMAGNTLKGAASGAIAGAQIAGPLGAVIGGAAGILTGIGGIFAGRSKAKKEAEALNELAERANYAKAASMANKAGALDQAADARSQAAYAADGGKINPFPSNFPAPVTEFNEGGSHESNPYDGIPQGIAPDGQPNLVEEGEVKYDNYIFSDRLMLSKEDKKKYKYKGKTFADAAKAIKKELMIDERPNDPLALEDLDIRLQELSMLQEEKRAEKGLIGENRMMYAKGGHMFAGLNDFMRIVPVVGNAIGAMHQVFNRPDYEFAKELQKPEAPMPTIEYTPITQKMTYRPFDVNYYGNKLGAQAGATRRAIREQTASNPYASTAALLAADANAQGQLGDLYRKAEEFNLAQREKVATFNRATDSANAEMAMKAQQLNASLRNSARDRQVRRDLYAAQMKAAEDAAWSEAMSSSLTSLFNSIGNIGKERDINNLALLEIIGENANYTAEQKALMEKIYPGLFSSAPIPRKSADINITKQDAKQIKRDNRLLNRSRRKYRYLSKK